MTNNKDVPLSASDRRDPATAGAGAAAASGSSSAVVAQASTDAPPQAPAPGRVLVEQRGPILMIGLDRPQAQNRFDPPMLIGLGKAYYQLEHDDALRVAVLYGVGPNFCASLDVAAYAAAQASELLPPKDPDFMNPLGLRPPLRTKPVVVAVQGITTSVGDEIFLSADIRVASSDTVFAQYEVTRGVFPGGGATVRLTREAGWGNAMR